MMGGVAARARNLLAQWSRAGRTEPAKHPGRAFGPDFLCVGAQKGGTRWLFDQLDHHPDFWMPPIKELHYFDGAVRIEQASNLLQDMRRDLAAANEARRNDFAHLLDERDFAFLEALLALDADDIEFSGYKALFLPKGDRLSGDVTPRYAAMGPVKISAIATYLPDAKIVYMVREPVGRLWSEYMQARRNKEDTSPVDWKSVSRFLDTGKTKRQSRPSIIASEWRRFLPERRFGLFFFDDLLSDPVGFRRNMLTFLGADPDKPSGDLPADFNRKTLAPKLPMSDEIRERLVAVFADELRACASELGGPAMDWPKKYGL